MTLANILLLHLSLKERGLTFLQLAALSAVEGGSDTSTSLCKATHTTLAGASEMAERLVQLGLLHRTADFTDRRVHLLSLTDKGKAKLSALLAS